MSKKSVEEIKRESAQLRGGLAHELAKDTTHFNSEDIQLLKFHGAYQQDDRDLRKELKTQKKEPAYSMMVRSAIPGGRLTAEQYLVHDRCADQFGNGTVRITSRQGFQLHGILKGDLQGHIRAIVASGLTTLNACGDVCRNTMGTPTPLDTPTHRAIQALAEEIAVTFRSQSKAYAEIWIDGEKLDLSEAPLVEEPIYGDLYLPRKFKMGIAAQPINDVDVYTQDIGLIPHDDGARYTIIVGGGMGMTNNKTATYPALAKPLGDAKREDLMEFLKAIVTTQRDHGDRTDRKHARMKYTVEDMGLDAFRKEVLSRVPDGVVLDPPSDLTWDTVGDVLGWHEQGDGKFFVGIWVEDGRIKDTETVKWRTAFHQIAEEIGCPIRLTPNTNLIFHDIEPGQRARVEAILAENGVTTGTEHTAALQTSQACVALPTCGLALAESERYFPNVMEMISEILREFNMAAEPLLVRMTGCPNGCARPYNADIAFVGRGPGRYALYVGGSSRGDRLAGLHINMLKAEDIEATVRDLLTQFRDGRQPAERFSDWWGRTQTNGEAPHPDQFHVEFAERKKN